MSNTLKISDVITADMSGIKKVQVTISDNKNEFQGTATLTVKEGHNIEQKFENLIKLLIKESK